MIQHVLSSGMAHELRSVIAGDDMGARLISGPVPQIKIHLLALCRFIHAFVEHYHIGFLTDTA